MQRFWSSLRSGALPALALFSALGACGEATRGALSAAGGAGGEDAGHGLGDVQVADARNGPARFDVVPFLDARPPRDGEFHREAGAEAGSDGATADARTSPDAEPPAQCLADLDCDDGFFCNGAEQCGGNRCVVDPNPPCADVSECTQNLCDEEHDTCVFIANDNACAPDEICDPKVGCLVPLGCVEGVECDDALPCNGLETCVERQCRPGQPVSCADAVACTVNTCDDASGECVAVPDHSACAPGELCDAVSGCGALPPCRRNDDCDDGVFCNGQESCEPATGLCRGGAPPVVDDEVDCTVDACSEVSGAVTHLPVNARCSDGAFCNGFEVCHPVEGCVAGTAPSLEDGVGCTTGRCIEAADFVEQQPDDAACDDGLFCNGAERCELVAGCRSGAPPAVIDGVGCTVDACSEAMRSVLHRPDDSLCDDGVFCNGSDVCDAARGCVAGPELVLDDGVECTEDSCLEARGEISHVPVDARCTDALFCNGDEVCLVDVGCQAGPAPVVADALDCTLDTCDEARQTVVHAPLDAVCDNGESCDGVESCDTVRGCLPGFTPQSDDGIFCTLDLCDPDTGAISHRADDRACDDGLFCTGAETCDVLRGCLAGTPPLVADAVPCTADACDETTDAVIHTPESARCDDGLFCNGSETCDVLAGCLAGPGPALSDAVDCTTDTCDEANDGIVHSPDDGACSDRIFCNGAEVCDVVRGCLGGPTPVLTDEVACTTDACDEVDDRVTHTPDNAICNDSLFCNGSETCDAVLGCRAGAPPVVADNVACTTDACDEANDRVNHTPNNAICNDNQFCNGVETCDAALGCRAGAAPVLTDNVVCTTDACDEANDRITHAANNGVCTDNNFCNGAETCDLVRDCQAGVAPALTDGIPCTTDACDEANDRITHVANNAVCGDNLFCNGSETCDVALGCRAGTPPVVADNVVCTTDACDEANDRVNHTPNNAICNDNQFCNGVETCDAALGCRGGAAPVLTDNVVCTTDACDEANDRITHAPDNGLCTDNLFCNGTETCDLIRGCLSGAPPVVADAIACTTDACDEANDRITHAANNGACSDGLFCNGTETCDLALGCRPGAQAANGSVCLANPRNICLAGACAATRCGDGYLDAGATPAEQCDGGANCTAMCQLGGLAPNYNGRFSVLPRIVYSCAFGLVNINTSQFVFSVAGNILSVSGLSPGVMRQNPAPVGANFSVTLVVAGGCTETYTLSGTFSDADHWCGVMTLGFNGAQCGLTECTNQTINVCGTRL